jgi:hypothetical protein
MSAESEGDVVAELGMNCNLEKTMASVCPAWRCPHPTPLLELESSSTPSWRCPHHTLHVKRKLLVTNDSGLLWWAPCMSKEIDSGVLLYKSYR